MVDEHTYYSHGDPELIEAVSRHIGRRIGRISVVYDEIVSPDIHVDVYHVRPGVFRRHHTLVTSGMSERGMSIPAGIASEWRHAELLMKVWKAWPGLGEPPRNKDFWPIRMLKQIARYPHENGTWLGPGHSVAFERDTGWTEGFAGAVLIPTADVKTGILRMRDERVVHFYVVIPLYAAELEFKIKHGLESFLGQIERADRGVDLVRPGRQAFI